jgi:hypothetical protein
MARITIEDLVVTSFTTGEAPSMWEDALALTQNRGCICTGDISTCSRTSVQGGCDTSVQCVTG